MYIPFHFIPPDQIRFPKDSFVTVSNSPFAIRILKAAYDEPLELPRLCRIGVALHTFADTWAHQGFSGRLHAENDVENIYHLKEERWDHQRRKGVLLNIFPQVGHTEAWYYPDYPFLMWKYTRKLTNEVVERNNTNEFLTAAETIYHQLCEVEKSKSDTPIPWGNIEPKIRNLLAYREHDKEKRCGQWRERFQHMFDPLEFRYDKQAWRNEALEPDNGADTDWDDFSPSEFKRLRFHMSAGFYDSRWVQFHRAALRQRHFVLENLF